MKCISKLSLAIALLFLACPFVDQASSTVSGQDITITVRKDDKPNQPFSGSRAAVDVAILLDTSNSMDGLISQAKSQLWKIVQEFGAAEKAGKTPKLRVAVFEYGNTNLPASEGYIRQVCQLTNDLDKVSEALFSLTTDGGDEYCGTVIQQAIKRLDWSTDSNSYKAIFIAGNEPFTQGSIDYKDSCREAIEKGVVINTIHCGNFQTGVQGKWQHGAELAEGKYMNINQDRAVVRIKAPQDKIIIELNKKFNDTYLWYGAKAERDNWKSNQLTQDLNSYRSGGGGGRGATKASSLYDNSGRDLIDSLKGDGELLSKLEVTALPESLQRMSDAERKAHIEKLGTEREQLKAKIKEVTAARAAFVAAERRKLAEASPAPGEGAAGATLGDAVSGAVREQLESSGFTLKKK